MSRTHFINTVLLHILYVHMYMSIEFLNFSLSQLVVWPSAETLNATSLFWCQ